MVYLFHAFSSFSSLSSSDMYLDDGPLSNERGIRNYVLIVTRSALTQIYLCQVVGFTAGQSFLRYLILFGRVRIRLW